MSNYRNKALLEVVRESPCQMCGAKDGTAMYTSNQFNWRRLNDWFNFWKTHRPV
jgi:hypothetical protein